MADHMGGVSGDISKPDVMAQAIVNAAQERFSGMHQQQIPRNSLGVLRAAESHLSKREKRETGKIHKGSLAARTQGIVSVVESGGENDVEQRVRRVMAARKIGAMHE